MKTFYKYFSALFFSASLVLFAISCKKDFGALGKEFIKEGDLIQMGYDTLEITAYTVKENPLYTFGMPLGLVGSCYDPVFGKSVAGIFVQAYKPSEAKAPFFDKVVIDSAFVYLPYQSMYGADTTSMMNFKVYELSENINDSISHNSASTVNYFPTPIGEKNIQINDTVLLRTSATLKTKDNKRDSVVITNKRVPNTLKIPLNKDFREKFALIDTTTLYDGEKFSKAFKGIYITTDNMPQKGLGAIGIFAMDKANIKIYYHKNKKDSLSLTLSLNNARFNKYNHFAHTDADPALKQQIDGDVTLGEKKLYIQGTSGTKVKILFPDFNQKLNNKNMQVVDAQLIVSNLTNDKFFPNPSSLSLYTVGIKGTTNPEPILDSKIDDEKKTYFDGKYNPQSSSYRFRVTQYIQQLIKGELSAESGIFLSVPYKISAYSPNRLVFNGAKNTPKGIKLYVRYTKITQ